ncbi:MAG: hypothetical protein WC822_05905 [Candidatus Paceibacterota bacterium]|jgi:hypothetical protein
MKTIKMKRYTTAELEAMPTLSVGQADNLKLVVEDEDGTQRLRYWLSRCSVEDGEPFEHTVYVETPWKEGWCTALAYNGDNLRETWE